MKGRLEEHEENKKGTTLPKEASFPTSCILPKSNLSMDCFGISLETPASERGVGPARSRTGQTAFLFGTGVFLVPRGRKDQNTRQSRRRERKLPGGEAAFNRVECRSKGGDRQRRSREKRTEVEVTSKITWSPACGKDNSLSSCPGPYVH